MPSTRPVRCTTLAPMAVGVRSWEPTALCIEPSHEPTREGPASGFVGRAITSPACVARGHRLDRVSPVTGGRSCSIVTCLAGYPCAFRKPHRGWHRNSMSSDRLRRATATGLRHAVSTQPGCSQPWFTSTLQLAPSCYPRISGVLALAPIAGQKAGQAGGIPFGTGVWPRTIWRERCLRAVGRSSDRVDAQSVPTSN